MPVTTLATAALVAVCFAIPFGVAALFDRGPEPKPVAVQRSAIERVQDAGRPVSISTLDRVPRLPALREPAEAPAATSTPAPALDGDGAAAPAQPVAPAPAPAASPAPSTSGGSGGGSDSGESGGGSDSGESGGAGGSDSFDSTR